MNDWLDLMGYLSVVRSTLRMDNWNIIVMDEESEKAGWDDGTLASTQQSNNHDTMQIWFHPDWREWDSETMRNTIVHELIHALHRDVSMVWDDAVKNNDSIADYQSRLWEADFKMYMERFVSNFTRAVESFVPLPSAGLKIGPGVSIIHR